MKKNDQSGKKTIRERIKDEFVNSLIKYVVWTIPLTIILFFLNNFYDKVLYPPLKVNEMTVEIQEDKQVFSPDNTELPGREIIIDNNGEVMDCKYHAPELNISLKGKGQIKAAYAIYEYSEKLLVQRIGDMKNSWTGIKVNPDELRVTINYYTDIDDDDKLVYIVLIGKNNDKNIWCGYVNPKNEQNEFRKSQDIFELMLYSNKDDRFSMNKEKIIEDITKIYDMNL